MESNHNQLNHLIISQIEYYFGDFNLCSDYFMKEIILKDNGWVSIETLLKFNRLKSLTNCDKELLINSVKNSKSDLIELSECGRKIRRRPDKPLPQVNQEYKQKLMERTVHVKGFPKDLTLDQIMGWCKQYGNIESVQMRRFKKNNLFNGSIFVTFSLKSMADQMVNNENLKFNDKVLLKENKAQYHERRRQFYEEKKRLITEAKSQLEEKLKIESGNQMENNGVKQTNPVKVELAVLKLKGLPKSLSFAKVKQYFGDYGKVAFVTKTNSRGLTFVLFANQLDAKNVLAQTRIQSNDQTSNKVLIDGNEAMAEVLTGEHEKKFWIQANKRLEKSLINKKNERNAKKSLRKQQSKDRKRTTSDVSMTNGSKQLRAQNN